MRFVIEFLAGLTLGIGVASLLTLEPTSPPDNVWESAQAPELAGTA